MEKSEIKTLSDIGLELFVVRGTTRHVLKDTYYPKHEARFEAKPTALEIATFVKERRSFRVS